MQKENAVLEESAPIESVLRADTAASHGVSELDVTLVRATNYADDGYPIKMKICVIRSNTLSQMATLTRDIVTYPFFKGTRV